MRKRVSALLFFAMFMIAIYFTHVDAKAPEKYFENNLFEYGSTYSLSSKKVKITSSDTSIATVSGTTVSIVGTGNFTLTVTANGQSKTIKCFAWNVCLKSGKCKTYDDMATSKESEPLYAKTYLATSTSGKVLKVKDYLCTTGSYRGDLTGKYIVNYNGSNDENAANFEFFFKKSSTKYDGTLSSVGLPEDGNAGSDPASELTGTWTTTEEGEDGKPQKTITIRYREYTGEGDGSTISGIGSVSKVISEKTTIRRDKNTAVINKGYFYKGVSIDDGKINGENISADVDIDNYRVTFWYVKKNVTAVHVEDPNKDKSPTISRLTKEQAGIIVSNYAIYTVKNHDDEWIYSYGVNHTYGQTVGGKGIEKPEERSWAEYAKYTYEGKKCSGWAYGTSTYPKAYIGKPWRHFENKYSTDCSNFCIVMYHWALGLGEKKYTRLTFNGYTETVSGIPNTLNVTSSKQVLKPGDIIAYTGHFVMYVGNGKLCEMQCEGIMYESMNKYEGRQVKYVLRLTDKAMAQINRNLDNIDLRFLYAKFK